MRTILILALLAPLAAAGEHDGANAPARRWTHPRGPASRSCISSAHAIESLGDVVWTYKSKAPISVTPLTWDGTGYLRAGGDLIAIDLETGKRVASQNVGATSAIALGEGAVFLVHGTQLKQWRRSSSAFRNRWTFDVGAGAGAPCIEGKEIYITGGGKLMRLRSGAEKPVWSKGAKCYGDPALMGEEIYALETDGDGKAALVCRARLDGSEKARVVLGASGKTGMVALNREQACVRIDKRWVMVRRAAKDGKITLDKPWSIDLTAEPLLYSRAVIGIGGKDGALMLYRITKKKNIRQPMVKAAERQDLLKGAGLPMSMQSVFSCGLWTGDINANRIRWHLHERPDRRLFDKGVGLRPVPADNERLLIVSADRKRIICIKPEVIGS